MDKTELLLKELTEANGVSGYENEIRGIMTRKLRGVTSKVEFDRLGSVMGTMKGPADSPRVMIIAHMDEIGFMVKEVTKDGYLKFLPLGGWWGHVALGQRMRVITRKGTVLGVVGSKPPHILPPEERKKVLAIKDMFIDIGATETFDVKKKLGVRAGDPVVPDATFDIMGNKKLYMSKAFDNRVACAIVLEVMKKLKASKAKHPNTILGCASVQEEVGLRGAQTLAHMGNPDVCIVIDVGLALDIPPEGFAKSEKLGGGPSIGLFDAGMIPNTVLRDLVIDTAEKKKIPYHLACMEGGATDGARVHVSRFGVPTICVGPPVRYIHSHNGILHRADYDNSIKLVTEVIKKLDKKKVASLTEA